MSEKSKILILGGTEFVGRQLVERLIKNHSYEVFLFNRGKTNPGLFPKTNRIVGDRETDDIKKIRQYDWDYVVDFSAFYPRVLKATLDNLTKKVKKYIFISSISAYSYIDYDSTFEIKENYKTVTCSKAEQVDTSKGTYGKRKAECERLLSNTNWLDSVILRPSIIYGRFDPKDRLYYWIYKVKNRKPFVLPESGIHKLSLSYSEDFVSIILKCMKNLSLNGIYNASTHSPLELSSIIHIIAEILQVQHNAYRIPQEWLIKEHVKSQKDIPLWFGGNLMYSNSKIKKDTKINFTPFKESIRNAINFYEQMRWPSPKIGLNEIEEGDLIEKYKITSGL